MAWLLRRDSDRPPIPDAFLRPPPPSGGPLLDASADDEMRALELGIRVHVLWREAAEEWARTNGYTHAEMADAPLQRLVEDRKRRRRQVAETARHDDDDEETTR